jgi:hypothetical protein
LLNKAGVLIDSTSESGSDTDSDSTLRTTVGKIRDLLIEVLGGLERDIQIEDGFFPFIPIRHALSNIMPKRNAESTTTMHMGML